MKPNPNIRLLASRDFLLRHERQSNLTFLADALLLECVWSAVFRLVQAVVAHATIFGQAVLAIATPRTFAIAQLSPTGGNGL